MTRPFDSARFDAALTAFIREWATAEERPMHNIASIAASHAENIRLELLKSDIKALVPDATAVKIDVEAEYFDDGTVQYVVRGIELVVAERSVKFPADWEGIEDVGAFFDVLEEDLAASEAGMDPPPAQDDEDADRERILSYYRKQGIVGDLDNVNLLVGNMAVILNDRGVDFTDL